MSPRFIPIALILAALARAEPPPARYQVRDGAFRDVRAGAAFRPRGFNYIRLHRGHGTFDPEFYDGAAAERLCAGLSRDGFNSVRVFINGHAHVPGSVAREGRVGLSLPYVANVADFLRRADRRGVGVVLSTDAYPRVPPFSEAGPNRRAEIHPANAAVLVREEVETRARYLRALIEALRAADAACLDAVLAYDLQNEWCYVVAPPFTLSGVSVTAANGRVYELPAQRRELADDGAVYCLDALAQAVRSVHPRAPVWAGVFTCHAVGRGGPGDWREESAGWKNRMPFRPVAILRSQADVLDVHFYPENESVFEADLRSIEFAAVREAARARGAALVAGEFGAFKSRFPAPESAADWMSRLPVLFGGNGFSGWLYWTYDTHEQDAELWHACAADGLIYRSLRACPP